MPTATTTRRAQCSCGQLSVEVEGDPVRISMCHCYECQRRTGSAFGAQARFPKERFTASGSSTTYTRLGDSGHAIHFHFCPKCGSTVYYTLDRAPEGVAVALGAFADNTFPAPKISVYEARKHAWVGLPEGIEHMD